MICLLLALTSTSHAQASPVDVEVTLVLASTSGVMDPKLKSLQKVLARQRRYTGFEHIGHAEATLARGEVLEVPLRKGQVLKVEYIDHNETTARMRLRRMHEERVIADSTMSVHRNTPLLYGGQRLDDGRSVLHPLVVSW